MPGGKRFGIIFSHFFIVFEHFVKNEFWWGLEKMNYCKCFLQNNWYQIWLFLCHKYKNEIEIKIKICWRKNCYNFLQKLWRKNYRNLRVRLKFNKKWNKCCFFANSASLISQRVCVFSLLWLFSSQRVFCTCKNCITSFHPRCKFIFQGIE